MTDLGLLALVQDIDCRRVLLGIEPVIQVSSELLDISDRVDIEARGTLFNARQGTDPDDALGCADRDP